MLRLATHHHSSRWVATVQRKKVTEMKLQDANMKVQDDGNNKAAAWILFWLLGYPIAVVMFLALSDLKLM
jgi:hypothetical protein